MIVIGFTQLNADPVYYTQASEIGTSPEMISLGNINGFSQGAYALFESPAVLPHIDDSYSFFYSSLSLSEQRYLNVAISRHINDTYTIGIGAIYETIPNNDITASENGRIVSIGTFDYYSLQLNASFGMKLNDDISIGAALNHYSKDLYNVSGEGLDAAIAMRVDSDYGITNIMIKNILGATVDYSNDSQETLSTSWEFTHRFNQIDDLRTSIYTQFAHDSDISEIRRSIGAKIYPMADPSFSVNIGLKELRNTRDKTPILSTGVSLVLPNWSLHYAFDQSMVVESQAQHFISINLNY